MNEFYIFSISCLTMNLKISVSHNVDQFNFKAITYGKSDISITQFFPQIYSFEYVCMHLMGIIPFQSNKRTILVTPQYVYVPIRIYTQQPDHKLT